MPVTPTPREVADVLEEARQLFVQDGWHAHLPYNHPIDWLNRPFKRKREPGKPWFITQAISYVVGREDLPINGAAYRALTSTLGCHLRDWQFDEGRTIEDVLELFDKTIASLTC